MGSDRVSVGVVAWKARGDTRLKAARSAISEAELTAASGFVQSVAADRPARAMAQHAVRHPIHLMRCAFMIVRLSSARVRISGDSPDGAEVVRVLRKRTFGIPTGRLARSALRIPEDPADYARGRARQALRTNARRAREQGVTCREVCDRHERHANLIFLCAARGWPTDLYHADVQRRIQSSPETGRHFIAESSTVAPLVVAVLVEDVECAYLKVFMRVSDDRAASDARYLLTLHIVNVLARDGIRWLLATPALQVPPNIQYFQQRLGFSAINLRLHT